MWWAFGHKNICSNIDSVYSCRRKSLKESFLHSCWIIFENSVRCSWSVIWPWKGFQGIWGKDKCSKFGWVSPVATIRQKVSGRKLCQKSQKTESEKLHCYEMASIVTQAVSRFLREWLSPSRMSLIHCEDWRCALDLWLWAFPYADCSSATKESEREPDPFDVYKKGKNSAFS